MGRADGDRIGPDANKSCMAQADLAGKAHQQVQSDPGKREHENQRGDAIVVGGGEVRWQHRGNHRHCGDRHQPGIEQRAHAHTRSTLARPNRPCGMANSTARMMRKATASLYCEDK